ncbi:MAG TPA: hypothetical protein GX716_00605 [Firmicutes bacterium]|nr:hypothetical protein [Candidatus Fermentithermobacillaceae bacterium]
MKFKVCKPSQVRFYEDGQFRRLSDVARQEGAIAGIDAGFYAGRPETHPKGSIPCGKLVINDKVVRPAADSSPDGPTDGNYHAVYKKGGRIYIDREIPPPEPGNPVEWGIKIGPRLLEKGQVCKTSINDPRWDVRKGEGPRVVIAVKADGDIIFAYHQSATLENMAIALKALGCVEALNCDGGSSASFYDADFGINVGYKLMPNFFLMMPSRPEGELPRGDEPLNTKGIRVYISPSQQPENMGVGDFGTEQRRMFELGWLVASELSRLGFQVKISRPGMTLKEIDAESDTWPATYHMSLHSNSMPKDKQGQGRGTEGFHWPGSVNGARVTRAICEALALFNPGGFRRVEPNASLAEIAAPNAYCVYLEVGFHDRQEEAEWIVKRMDFIAKVIAGAFAASVT